MAYNWKLLEFCIIHQLWMVCVPTYLLEGLDVCQVVIWRHNMQRSAFLYPLNRQGNSHCGTLIPQSHSMVIPATAKCSPAWEIP